MYGSSLATTVEHRMRHAITTLNSVAAARALIVSQRVVFGRPPPRRTYQARVGEEGANLTLLPVIYRKQLSGLLPAAPAGTTDQISPTRAEVPDVMPRRPGRGQLRRGRPVEDGDPAPFSCGSLVAASPVPSLHGAALVGGDLLSSARLRGGLNRGRVRTRGGSNLGTLALLE